MLANRPRRDQLLSVPFTTWLNQQPELIRYPAANVDGQTNRIVHNLRVTGVEDSALFPKADVIVNGTFAADTDWLHPDPAITIAGGQATWSGAQAGDADLTATVAPLISGDRYGRYIVLSGVTAGTLTPLFGTQAGAAMNASGTYPIDEQVANSAAFVLRGDSSFTGSCELIRIRPANPLNASITSATVAQLFGRGGLRYANLYDGNNDEDVVDGASLAAGYSLAHGEIMVFGKIPSAGIWADGTRRALFFLQAGSDLVVLRKGGVSNRFEFVYEAGGVNKAVNFGGLSTLGNFMASIKFSDTNNSNIMQGFFNQQSTSTDTGFGVADTVDGFWIGSKDGTQYWSGLISAVILHPEPLTDAKRNEYYRRWEG